MTKTNTLQNHNEVQILLPTQSGVKEYQFKNVSTKNKLTTTVFKKVAIGFSGIENNLLRYQLICLDYDIEAKHLGSTTILRKVANVFNEVKIYVNQNGTITSIINLKQLQERWQNAKKELLEMNEGATLLDFLSDTDELMENQENVLKFVSSKEMYGLYFNSCWGYHDINKPRFEELEIHIEKRILYDQHTQHLQKPYSQDATLVLKSNNDKKQKVSEITYKNNQLQEAFLEIISPTKTSKYSIICLTT
ncbi:hypothetical protein [Flavobacterium sp.]|uniref:hypothetical protein n=1 Tax=Flavobacterium sp. TaxID=239 RepID=UPI00286BCFF3|nr:hypothetical protein [Flavobacterium sp.]